MASNKSAALSSEDTRADYGCISSDDRLTAEEMDKLRSQATAYEYLCHLEESKQWLEYCLQEDLPPSIELEESLRNGVYLGKLAHYFAPETVPLRKIYDKDLKKYQQKGLHFKHTDNINHFYRAMQAVGLPPIFYPETTDIYDRKNMPKTIYCVHALSLYLFKLGKAPQMKDLYGIAEFTEEELSNMQKELDKYGIQMPQFNKIGGILANELSVDEAALHAAVILINEALEVGDVAGTMQALTNPNACLAMIEKGLDEEYQNRLLASKKAKIEASQNKSKDKSDEERDAYEELLTHAELQGNVNKINLDVKLENLNRELESEGCDQLLKRLNDLSIANVSAENAEWYAAELKKELAKKREATEDSSVKLDKDEIQAIVNTANQLATKQRLKEEALRNINSFLVEDGSPEDLCRELRRAEADLPSINEIASVVYLRELVKKKEELGRDLTHEEIADFIPFLNAIDSVNRELDVGDVEAIWSALSKPELNLQRLDAGNKTRVCNELKNQKSSCEYLTIEKLQAAIDNVNAIVQEEHARVNAVNDVNKALSSNDKSAILLALQNPSLQLQNVEPNNITQYQRLLNKKKKAKIDESGDPDVELWIDEIQACIDLGNKQTRVALKQASAVTAVNIALEDDDWQQTYDLLRSSDLALVALVSECSQTYHEQLKEVRSERLEEGFTDSTWVAYKTREGDIYYFNTDTLDGSWDEPDSYNSETAQLTKEELQECISMVSAAYDRAQLWKDNEDFIVKLQAYTKMHLARKAYKQRKDFMENQLPAVITMQAHWRGYAQMKKYNERLDYFRNNQEFIIKMQKWVRMWLAKSKYRSRLQYFRDHLSVIVRLQAWFRSNKARHDYKTLIGVENPPLPVVQRFVHLLDQRTNDFAEEIELQDLKKRVVQCIKENNELEQALNLMDIKIGLLVKNRITLQDVINHSKNLKKNQGKEQASSETATAAGLKSLNKTNRARLEAYQHIFYLLQTNPTYFGKLIFKISAGRTNNFMQSVILSVYNYASNQREEYLLLKLFRTALQEEIDYIAGSGQDNSLKVDKVKEIATGNPLVIKMVVTFNRGAKGQSSLRHILAPQVQEVMKNKTLNINMSPIEIYKSWINQRETETGEATDLPYEVNTEQAMKHDEVKKRVEDSIHQLRTVTEAFMNAIVSSIDEIPYGLRYIAKCLKNLLKQKFPDTEEDEVLKMVGNLIYYRYMNPAIVAPDGFDIIDVSAGATGLNNDQRRNLGSIAKVLQFASTGKTFAGDMEHLHSINSYLVEAYERFKQYFNSVCDVPEPEEKYNMDEYSDAVLLVKPVIFIRLKEIIDTHKLLLEHVDEIAPDTSDPLHDILDELGEVPDINTLLGESGGQAPDNEQLDHLMKTEVSLTLTSRIEIKEDDDSDVKNILLRTKRMVIDIIRVQVGENLSEVLDTPATDDQEEEHMQNVKNLEERKRKEEKDKKGDDESMLRTRSLLNENKLPLEDMKVRVRRNLEKLEESDIVSSKDHYQTIVNMIARDIRNQRRYRQRRKQELTKLKQNMDRLDQKAKFFEEQSDYYNQYIKSCLQSLANKTKKAQKKKKKNPAVKYTAAELQRKKILLEIDGLESERLRNVMFDISQSDEDVGKFDINAKVLGVNMDKVSIVFQDLLQLQYEGVSMMKLNVSNYQARINVNLLIFLLNKKFYGK